MIQKSQPFNNIRKNGFRDIGKILRKLEKKYRTKIKKS
jgi:hypothetical protein